MRDNAFRLSLVSGVLWAVIGLIVAFTLSGGFYFHPLRVAVQRIAAAFAGGVIVAPVIGVIMGQASRLFGYVEEVLLRILLAGITLYAAFVLFIMASFVVQSQSRFPRISGFWTDTFALAAFAFELTCIVLWPLAYVNHTLVSRAWALSRVTHVLPNGQRPVSS